MTSNLIKKAEWVTGSEESLSMSWGARTLSTAPSWTLELEKIHVYVVMASCLHKAATCDNIEAGGVALR